MKIWYIVTPTLLHFQLLESKTIRGSPVGTFNQKLVFDDFLPRHIERRSVFKPFKNVKLSDVWNEAKSEKVVSYTIARDFTQVTVGTPIENYIKPFIFTVPYCAADVDHRTSYCVERPGHPAG